MARYALERIPGSAVDEALLAALGTATGKAKVGVVNTLGQRKCAKASGSLAGLMGDSDETLAAAAAAALGEIADSIACEALGKAMETTKGKVRLRVLDAYLKCADAMVKGGNKAQARPIYTALQKAEMPTPIRTAALRGVIGSGAGR